MKELIEIQKKLNAPKGQYNSFGKYRYRSCEDILASVKPLLYAASCTLTISDDVMMVGDRIYIKATATLINGKGEQVVTTAFAREEDAKKGMDASQVTGAASSYARKYALNGLFAIDDTKDADALNTNEQYTQAVVAPSMPKPTYTADIEKAIAATTTLDALKVLWDNHPSLQSNAQFTAAMSARKDQIKKNGKS